MIAGLFLSKFDTDGWTALGFESAKQAFNVIGLALNAKPDSIKNLRDEFDRFFPNPRKGWDSPMKKSRKPIFDKYKGVGFDEFIVLIKRMLHSDNDVEMLMDKIETDSENTFAKRLMTGQAAENYFCQQYKSIDEFRNYDLEDTTKLGCGFDFKLHNETGFLGVEVKGLGNVVGNISLTNKEYTIANELKNKYYLFVVRNFNDAPFHDYFCNPLYSELKFKKTEQTIIQISWATSIK